MVDERVKLTRREKGTNLSVDMLAQKRWGLP